MTSLVLITSISNTSLNNTFVSGLKPGKLLSKTLEKANQLLEVKAALEQLSIENSMQSSVSYSSMSEYDSEMESERVGHRYCY